MLDTNTSGPLFNAVKRLAGAIRKPCLQIFDRMIGSTGERESVFCMTRVVIRVRK